jgi:hypothetical protein
MFVGMGFSELVLLLGFGGLLGGGSLLGLPPGERDAGYLRAAPADSLLYFEWAERSGGEAGAEGIDGLAADPEVRQFLVDVEAAILKGIRRASDSGPEERIMAESIPPLVKSTLMHSGCLYAAFDEQAAARALAEGEPTIGPAAVALGIEGAFVLNAGDEADEIAKHVNALLDLARVPATVRRNDLQHQVIPLPVPNAKLELHREGSYFVLAFGEGVVEAAVAGLKNADTKGLGSNVRFTKALALVETERTGGVAWLDVKGTLNAVVGALGFQGQMVKSIAESTGLDAVDSMVTVTGVVDGRLSTRSFVTTGGSVRGLLAFADGRPLKNADLAQVPGDADLVYVISLDGKKVLAAVRDVVTKSDPTGFAAQQLNRTLMQLDEELGFSIEKGAFEAFGDVWTVFDSPSAGGVVLTGATLSLEVRDHAKAEPIYTRLMELLEASLPGVENGESRRNGVELRKMSFLEHDVYFVNTYDDDMPFAPAFCLTKSHLFVAPNPQAIKAELRFLASGEPNFGTRLGPMIAAGDERSIPLAIEGEAAVSFSYVDLRQGLATLYALVPYMGQSMMGAIQQEGGDITAFSIPSARAVLPYAKDSFQRVTRTEEGLLFEGYNGVPVPGVTTVLLQVPLLMMPVRGLQIGGGAAAPRAMAAPAAADVNVAVPAVRAKAVAR